MYGLDSSSNPRDGKLDKSGQTRENLSVTDDRPPLPDYSLLRTYAGRLMTTRHKPPLTDEQREQLAWADIALREALLELIADDPRGIQALKLLGLETLSKTIDTKTEQRLIEPALAKAHDFLKLYAEVIKQPPPDNLELIEQVLRHRRESLHQLHPRPSPQP